MALAVRALAAVAFLAAVVATHVDAASTLASTSDDPSDGLVNFVMQVRKIVLTISLLNLTSM
jgi:hypothetical protein